MAMCQQMDVPFLGSVPLDGRVAAAGDQGMPLSQLQPDGPVAKCLLNSIGGMADDFFSVVGLFSLHSVGGWWFGKTQGKSLNGATG